MRRVIAGMMMSVFVMVMLFSAGCSKKAKPVSAKFPGESGAASVTPKESGAEGALGEGSGGLFDEGDLALRQSQEARDLIFAKASENMKTIYFAYDSAALTPEGKAALEQAAQWLKENSTVNIRIEGNCDERGTTEYNLALGERRALSARRYLISLGINPDRIFTISYGEEKPAVQGGDESAWKFNRRDDFGISL